MYLSLALWDLIYVRKRSQTTQRMSLAGKVGKLAGLYAAGVNVGSAGLFYYDKEQAKARQWRVPEATLCASALAGGWVGGQWAMQQFKHKTVKRSFQDVWLPSLASCIFAACSASTVCCKCQAL